MTLLGWLGWVGDRLPRGVTVFTGETAEHYPAADDWHLDKKGNLWVTDLGGRQLALFFIGTALRAEAGPYRAIPPPLPAIPS